MIDLESLYFDWLLTCLDPDGAVEEVAYVGELLHNVEFKRRVGNDVNRAIDGVNLRKAFLHSFAEADYDPHVTNHLMAQECSWFEMLVALSRNLDYIYDEGVELHFIELVSNMGLDILLEPSNARSARLIMTHDQQIVNIAADNVDHNRFDRFGRGGMFPLTTNTHPDQRGVEIWDQHAAYFHEKLEGVLWTSTK